MVEIPIMMALPVHLQLVIGRGYTSTRLALVICSTMLLSNTQELCAISTMQIQQYKLELVAIILLGLACIWIQLQPRLATAVLHMVLGLGSMSIKVLPLLLEVASMIHG